MQKGSFGCLFHMRLAQVILLIARRVMSVTGSQSGAIFPAGAAFARSFWYRDGAPSRTIFLRGAVAMDSRSKSQPSHVGAPMKALKQVIAALVAGLMTAGLALAAEPPKALDKPEAAIKRALEAARSDIKVTSVTPSEIGGVYAAQIQNGPLVYVSADGKYFLTGDLYQIQPQGFVNLAEQRRSVDRAKAIAAVKPQDMVVFKPKDGTKAVINVFTDVECGWCQKLHKEMAQYNALGIEVRYLAFPRAGIGSEDYQKMVTVWCSKDRQATLTKFKNREPVPISTCKDNPVAAQYELGVQVGVEGTPALVTASGELLPGYLPPQELAQRLGLR